MKQSRNTLNFLKEHSLFFLILSVSALLRFITLFEYQFTLDELSGLNRTRFDSFSDLINKGVKIDAHPAFVQLLIFLLVKIFGYVNWIVKLPFLLFSLGASVYAYALVYRNYSKQSALISLSIFSFSLVFVFYAPIARMYISGLFFSLALLYYFFEIAFKQSGQKKHYVLLSVFALLCALNQHINALFALTLYVSGIFLITKDQRKLYILSAGAAVLFYLPHLPVTFYQLGLGGIGLEQGGWLEKPNWTIVFDFLKLLFGTWKIYLLILLLLTLRIFSNGLPRIHQSQLFLLFIFFLNYWIVYQYSYHQAPVYQHSSMLFSGSCMVLLFSSLLQFSSQRLSYWALGLLTLTLLYTTYIRKNYYGNCVTSVFEEQYKSRARIADRYGEKKLCSVFFDSDEFMQEIYGTKYPSASELHFGEDSVVKQTRSFVKLLSTTKAECLLLSSPTPLQEEIVLNFFPQRVEQSITQANNIRLYCKNEIAEGKKEGEKIIFTGNISGKDQLQLEIPGKQNVLLKNVQLNVEHTNEFPLSAQTKYSDLNLKEGNVILLEVRGKVTHPSATGLEACITQNSEKELLFYTAGSLKDGIIRDSSFCFYAQLYCGSKHHNWLDNQASMQFYLWNKNNEDYFIESIKLKAIDHWPQKWGFWD